MTFIEILSEDQPDEDWEDFVDRLEQYFITKMTAADDAVHRRAILLSVWQRNICPDEGPRFPPMKLKSKTYYELVDIVAKHYKPKLGAIVFSKKFYTRRKEAGGCPSSLLISANILSIVDLVPHWTRY